MRASIFLDFLDFLWPAAFAHLPPPAAYSSYRNHLPACACVRVLVYLRNPLPFLPFLSSLPIQLHHPNFRPPRGPANSRPNSLFLPRPSPFLSLLPRSPIRGYSRGTVLLSRKWYSFRSKCPPISSQVPLPPPLVPPSIPSCPFKLVFLFVLLPLETLSVAPTTTTSTITQRTQQHPLSLTNSHHPLSSSSYLPPSSYQATISNCNLLVSLLGA